MNNKVYKSILFKSFSDKHNIEIFELYKYINNNKEPVWATVCSYCDVILQAATEVDLQFEVLNFLHECVEAMR